MGLLADTVATCDQDYACHANDCRNSNNSS